jgi:hypothetical protein
MRVVTAVGSVIALLAACDRPPGAPQQTIRLAEAEIAHEMLDPGAAQFRNVRIVTTPSTAVTVLHTVQPHVIVCGEVNGKNSFGGYVGFVPFIVGIDQPAKAVLQPAPSPTSDEIEAECDAYRTADCTDRFNEAKMAETDRMLFSQWWEIDCEPRPNPRRNAGGA